MKKAFLYGAAVAAALCGFYLLRLRPSEPAYNRAKISQWIRIAKRHELESGLAQVGPEAIPYLIAEIDNPWARGWSKLWIKLPVGVKRHLAKWTPNSPSNIRGNAIAGLRGFGPEARSALPSLMKMAAHDQDAGLRSFARVAVGDIGQ